MNNTPKSQRAANSWRSNAEQSLADTRAELRLLQDPATRETAAKSFRLGAHLVDSYIDTLLAQENRLVRELGHTVLTVDWAYPSSANAAQFGCPKTGCWVLNRCTIKDGKANTVALSSYATKEAAMMAARSFAPERILEAQQAQVLSDAAIKTPVGFSTL